VEQKKKAGGEGKAFAFVVFPTVLSERLRKIRAAGTTGVLTADDEGSATRLFGRNQCSKDSTQTSLLPYAPAAP
jgi:hypothetical protein